MIVIFLSSLLIGFMFNVFTLSIRLTSLNRIINNTPVQLFENSIPLIDGENNLYFDKTVLYNNLLNYYNSALKRHTKTVNVNLYFYNQEDQSICVSNECDAVEVNVYGKCVLTFQYSRTIFYEIHKGARYGS